MYEIELSVCVPPILSASLYKVLSQDLPAGVHLSVSKKMTVRLPPKIGATIYDPCMGDYTPLITHVEEVAGGKILVKCETIDLSLIHHILDEREGEKYGWVDET